MAWRKQISYDQSNLSAIAQYQKKILDRLSKIELKLDSLHREHEIVKRMCKSTAEKGLPLEFTQSQEQFAAQETQPVLDDALSVHNDSANAYVWASQDSESIDEDYLDESVPLEMTRQMQKHFNRVKDSDEFQSLIQELTLAPLAVYYSFKTSTKKYACNTLLNDKLFLRKVGRLLAEAKENFITGSNVHQHLQQWVERKDSQNKIAKNTVDLYASQLATFYFTVYGYTLPQHRRTLQGGRVQMRKEVISYPEFHDVLMQLKSNGKKDLVNYLYLSIMFVTGARGNTIRKLKFKDFRAERGIYVL